MALTQEQLEQIRSEAARRVDAICDLAVRICNVPSPTGMEHERAEFVASLLTERGYSPEIDDVSNVYARRGDRGGDVILVDAHIDTVFPAGTEINAVREGNILRGPGVGDNSLSVASVITMLDVLDALGLDTGHDIVVVATVGEEGLGNLRGARAAVERYRESLGAHIVIDGKVGGVTHVAVGSKRWHLTVRGPGGHSYGAFGTPSAIHGLGRIIAAVAGLEVPTDPKTTFNVGVIDGGTSVNTIAASATALIDMRSVDPDELDQLSTQVHSIIQTSPGTGLETEIEIVGERPAGSRDKNDPLVKLAAATLEWLGYEPEYRAASTNLNIPASYDIPAVCIGISDGQRTHTVEEYVPVEPIADGFAQLLRVCLEASETIR